MKLFTCFKGILLFIIVLFVFVFGYTKIVLGTSIFDYIRFLYYAPGSYDAQEADEILEELKAKLSLNKIEVSLWNEASSKNTKIYVCKITDEELQDKIINWLKEIKKAKSKKPIYLEFYKETKVNVATNGHKYELPHILLKKVKIK